MNRQNHELATVDPQSIPYSTVFGWPYGLSNQEMASVCSQADLFCTFTVIGESNFWVGNLAPFGRGLQLNKPDLKLIQSA